MKTTILTLATLLLLSCSATKTTKEITAEEFNTYIQEKQYEIDFWKTTYEECKNQ